MRIAVRWVALAAATPAATVAVGALGLPSPALFAALLVGLVYALAGGVPLAPAEWVVSGSQAMVGVAMGASFDASSLTGSAAAGSAWPSSCSARLPCRCSPASCSPPSPGSTGRRRCSGSWRAAPPAS